MKTKANLTENEPVSNIILEINSEGFCIKSNYAAYYHFGYTQQELLGKKFKDFLEIDNQKLHEIESKISTSEDIAVNFESGFRHKNGNWVFIIWTMYWNQNANAVLCIGKTINVNEQRTIRENKSLQLLNSINESILEIQEMDGLFGELCKILVKKANFEISWVAKVNPSNIEIWYRESESYISNESLKKSGFLSLIFEKGNEAIQNSRPSILEINPEDRKSLPPEIGGIKSVLMSPFQLGEDKQWLFGIGSNNPEAFEESQINFIEKISSNLSYALRSLQNETKVKSNEQSLEKYIHELNLLNEVNNQILLADTRENLIKRILNCLVEKGNYKLAWMAFYGKGKEKESIIFPNYFDGDTNFIEGLYFDLNKPEILKGPTANCILTQKTTVTNFIENDDQYAFWREKALSNGLNSSIILYLNLEGNQKGVLAIYSSNKNAFDTREKIVLERLVQNLTYGIGVLENKEKSNEVELELNLSKTQLSDYKTVLNDISIVFTLNTEGRIISFNENFENTLNWNHNQLLGKSYLELNTTQQSKEDWNLIFTHLQEGKSWEGNLLLKSSNNKEIWFDTTIYPFSDASGTNYQYMVIAWDITEKKALEEKATFINSLVDSSDQAIYSLNLNGIITSWNKGAEKIFGFNYDEVIHNPIKDFISLENLNQEKDLASKIIKGESVNGIESEYYTKAGEKVYVNVSVSPIRNDNFEIIGYSKLIIDITRAKLAELKAAKSEKEKDSKNKAFETLKILSQISPEENNSIEERLYQITNIIPIGFEHPDLLSVQIKYKDYHIYNKSFRKSINKISCEEIHQFHGDAEIEVNYPEEYEFQESEISLMELICVWTNTFVNAWEFNSHLKERVKELSCLQDLQEIFASNKSNIEELLQKACDRIPKAWQFPENAVAQIKYKDKEYSTGKFHPELITVDEVFETLDGAKGIIKVGYSKMLPIKKEKLYLHEEYNLLYMVAENIKAEINQILLKNKAEQNDIRIEKILSKASSAFILLDTNFEILYSNKKTQDFGKYLFEKNLEKGQNLLDLMPDDIRQKFENLYSVLEVKGEVSYQSNNLDNFGVMHNYLVELILTKNSDTQENEIIFIANEISHIKQRETDIKNLITLLNELKTISSNEISHEFHKLQAIVELVQDLEIADEDLRDILSSSKSIFEKANLAIKKLMERINIPLKNELVIASKLKPIEKLIWIDNDEFSAKLNLRFLRKYFEGNQIYSLKSTQEISTIFKEKPDNGSNVLLLDMDENPDEKWAFINEYQIKNLKSPLILLSSNAINEIKQKAIHFDFIKNTIEKPINNEVAKSIFNKEIFNLVEL
ncbi:MAG: PAS domain S-box protein [Bacteroidia bacterium]|nr:PAS domain S-box protein [Bacteroidia bacterium]MCF8446103.1 PAS domain S-box protein [Bacteroidia bacterium]